jgi:hypothetical protein
LLGVQVIAGLGYFFFADGVDLLLWVIGPIKSMFVRVLGLGPFNRTKAGMQATHKPIRDAVFKGIHMLPLGTCLEITYHLFGEGLVMIRDLLPMLEFFEGGRDENVHLPHRQINSRVRLQCVPFATLVVDTVLCCLFQEVLFYGGLADQLVLEHVPCTQSTGP